jgi:prepilin-type N-terminal cleavage/methylation domain-containing protein
VSLIERLRRDEWGFTLVELLIGMTIGSIVLLAAFKLADVTLGSSKRIEQRADATQRGRNAMEQIVQALRSSVCIKQSNTAQLLPVSSTSYSTNTESVTFYARIAKPSGTGTDTFKPLKWTLTYDNAARTLTETRIDGTGTYPSIDYSTPVSTTTRRIISNVRRVNSQPVFSYYAYNASGGLDPYGADTPLTANPTLSATDLAKVAMIRLRFTAGATGAGATNRVSDATFDEAVRLRLVDPSDPSPQNGAVCRA